MLEQNKQEISNTNNSFVQQANGNIYNSGLGYSDVKEICHDVIKQELATVTKEAVEALNSDILNFINGLILRIEKLENPRVIEKLKTPKLQFVLHDTMKEYAKTDSNDTKEELVDLFIDRLKVNENSVEQYLIDESIKVLPQLSVSQAYFLGALTLRKVVNRGLVFIVSDYLHDRAMLYEYLNDISILDIHYLKLLNCCVDMHGTKYYIPAIDMLKNSYDLLFRHPITEQAYRVFLQSNPQSLSIVGNQIVYKMGGSDKFYLSYSSKQNFIDELDRKGKQDYLPILEEFINLFTPFTDEEIKNYLISLNENWEKAFSCLDKEEVTNIDLTPVGTYIGRRVVKKVTKRSTLSLQEFYT